MSATDTATRKPLVKVVHWVELDDRTDTRDIYSAGRAEVLAIIGDALVGWDGDTHTVMAIQVPRKDKYGEPMERYNPYPHPAHAKLSATEAAALEAYPTRIAFHEEWGM